MPHPHLLVIYAPAIHTHTHTHIYYYYYTTVDYAELPIIDISALKQPSITSGTDTENTKTKSEIRQKLAQQVRDAMFNAGFFYVVGHGYSEENVSIFDFDCDFDFDELKLGLGLGLELEL